MMSKKEILPSGINPEGSVKKTSSFNRRNNYDWEIKERSD